jgi:ribosome biogenesis protein BRX1
MQIVEKDPLQPNGPPEMSLVEIGPRFVLTPIRIFEGAFGGATVFANPGTLYYPAAGIVVGLVVFKAFRFFAEFVSPALVRSARRQEKGERYKERKLAQEERGVRQSERKREEDPLAVGKVFA